MAELGGHLDQNPDSQCRSGDPQLDQAVHEWLGWDKNSRTRAQVATLVAAGRWDELRVRLLGRMTFGTAGLRAPMGAGFNCINDLTIIQATQGLYAYLSMCFADLDRRGVVIGFDSRGQKESGCTSRRLANLTAAVLLSRGIPTHLFSTPVPTPYVPFGVRTLEAAAGVMITASHNPKEDNGYKVYWCNGAQICSPRDKEILRSIEENLEPWSASCWEEELAASSSSDPLEHVNRCYMEQLQSLCFHRDTNPSCPLRVVHSAFHGVGHPFIQEAFRTFALPPPIAVPEQRDPDPDFPSVRCPNPEEGESVLELAINLADREGAQLVLATDPDADRLAVAEMRSDGCGWKIFTGNEVAALLGWWMFSKWRETHGAGGNAHKVFMLATTVSSKILQALARTEGFQFEETLPGFKWIGNRIQQLTEEGNEVIFSFEESIGFLCGSLVPEKDGISSAAVVAELAAHLHSRNLNLQEQLHNIYMTYGYHISRTTYLVCHDRPTIQGIFSRLRRFSGVDNSYPQSCGGVPIVQVRDVTTGFDSSQPDHRTVLPVTRNSQMITFSLENGVVATLRTSGTEPKIKVYGEYCAAPGDSNVAMLEAELQKITTALVEEFLEPDKNKLIRRYV